MSSAGFVLVGGNSSRMGRDKALLPWHKTVLVEEVAAKVKEVAGSVTLIGDPTRYRHLRLPCVPDLHPNSGPLAGIHAALSAKQADLNLILACDMPDVDASLLSALLDSARTSNAHCTYVISEGRRHPLCAVYRLTALPTVERALLTSQLRLHDLLHALQAQPFPVTSILRNCNTPAEWAEVETLPHAG